MSNQDKKKGDPGEPLVLARQSYLQNPWLKTMVMLSDYAIEYNEEKQIFNKEQWRSAVSCLRKQAGKERLGEADQQEDRRREWMAADREKKMH